MLYSIAGGLAAGLVRNGERGLIDCWRYLPHVVDGARRRLAAEMCHVGIELNSLSDQKHSGDSRECDIVYRLID